MSKRSNSVVRLQTLLVVVLLSVAVACGADHDKPTVDRELEPNGLDEPQEPKSRAVRSQESGEAATEKPEEGPFQVGGDIEFLKPEDLAPEVREVIAEAVQEWRFSPATRAGQPLPVHYNLLIHHCPYERIRNDHG